MPEVLGPWPVVVASWVLTYLLHSSVIIALAWGLTRLSWLRGPRAQEVIWTVALLGGLATSLAATLGGPQRQATALEVDLRIVRSAGGSPQLPIPVDLLGWREAEVASLQAGGVPGEACRRALAAEGRGGPEWLRGVGGACASGGGKGWVAALLALWLAGVVLLVGREARRHGVLRRVRRSLEPPSPRVRSALQRAVAGTRVRHAARVAVSEAVDAPCVVDATTVVLPPRCQEELPDAELLAVLAHEVAHVGRRDVHRQALLRLATAVLWLQPLNRLVLRRLRDLAELICDDWAVGRIPSPLDLARSISRVAEWSAPASRREPAFAGSQGGRLSERVRRIVSSRGNGGGGGRLRGALVAALLLAALAQLPSIAVPRRTLGFVVLQDAVRVESGVQQVRVRVQRTDS